jgi:hypothetical protein
MQKPQQKSKEEKLNDFAERLHSIPIKNLKRLVASYQEEIDRLSDYLSTLKKEVERRELDA